MVRLEAPIVPNQGLGGFRLRDSVRSLQGLFTQLALSNEITFQLTELFEARYRLANGAVELAIDVRNGKIFKLTARSGYQGLLFGKVGVGMTVREAMARVPALHYEEVEELIFCRGCEGVSLDVPEIDAAVERLPDMTIQAINVYAAEITTLAGQNGAW